MPSSVSVPSRQCCCPGDAHRLMLGIDADLKEGISMTIFDAPARRRIALALMAALAVVALGAGTSQAAAPTQVGTVPDGAQKVMDQDAYHTARWLYDVADLTTGQVLLSNRQNEMVFTGSTAKNFTVGSAYALLGPDFRTTTPVYATAPVVNGTLDGDLVLVASGDLAMGGRNALQDQFDQSFSATAIDHVYGDLAPTAAKPRVIHWPASTASRRKSRAAASRTCGVTS